MIFKASEDILFPTPLWTCEAPEVDNDKIKQYCLKVRELKNGIKVSNRGGWHSRELVYPIEKELTFLLDNITKFVNKVCSPSLGVPNLQVGNFWININGQYDYNLPHDHQNSILSGTYYVSVPDSNMGDIVFHRDDKAEFFIHSGIHKTPNMFNSGRVIRSPQEGTFLLFPSWTRHHVERNESNKERISIAFNFVQPKN